jgi:hypothetical protein
MRKIAICALLAVFAACGTASAAVWTNKYKDIRRTGGHKRSNAEFNADLRACAKVAGIPYGADMPDPPAFKRCMLKRGLKWQYTRRNAPKRASQKRERTWIDPETGLTCREQNYGGIIGSHCTNY